MANITNTPGTYPAKISAVELGDISQDGTKPVMRLTYQDSDGNSIDHVLCLFGGALEISLRTLDKALGYKFATQPAGLVGKDVRIVTDNQFNAKSGKSFYGVKHLNAPGSGPLAAAPPNLLAQLAAKAKALPPEAPRPPRAPGQTSAPRPPQRPSAPSGGFADDDSVPF